MTNYNAIYFQNESLDGALCLEGVPLNFSEAGSPIPQRDFGISCTINSCAQELPNLQKHKIF